jgi:hypothetical protein
MLQYYMIEPICNYTNDTLVQRKMVISKTQVLTLTLDPDFAASRAPPKSVKLYIFLSVKGG